MHPIVPQIVGILAVATFLLSYQQKNRRAIIILNTVSRILYIVQYILLGAFSGCHIYMDSGDVFYANKNYITIHASKGGEKVIRLPRAMKATEVYEGTVYSECSDEIRFKIKRGETKMFRIE